MSSKNVSTPKTTVLPKTTTPVTVAPPAPVPAVSPAPVAQAVPKKVSVQIGAPKPVVTPSPSSNVSGLTPTASPAPSGSQSPGPQTTTAYTSTNWSGYLATGASFTAVSGSWAATNPTGNGLSTSADATWIGIGGVTSGDLIQVGTDNIVDAGGQVSAAAFYELLPAVSQAIPTATLTVNPGDSMTASITEVGANDWTITITDNTDNESYATTVTYASSLSSAEWIEEDPSYSFRQLIPFDNFHEAVFSSASAVANGSTVNLTVGQAQPVSMVDDNGSPVAVPSAISGGSSFTISP